MKEKSFGKLFFGIFALVGTIFLVVGIIICINDLSHDNEKLTTATITDIESYRDIDRHRHYRTFIEYTVDGEQYEAMVGSYSSGYRRGKEIEIYYDVDNPERVKVKGDLVMLYVIFIIMGGIFALAGWIGIVVCLVQKDNEKKLRLMNNVIYAEYMEVRINYSIALNGRHPYNVICSWNNPADGNQYILKSKNLWFNPSQKIMERGIRNFAVYMDPNNVKKYAIDVDVLTQDVVDLT